MFGIENDEFEVSCPNEDCYVKIRAHYSDAFNYGELNCYSCGTRIKLDYQRKSDLRNAVNDFDRAKSEYERAQQNLDNAIRHLLAGSDMTTKI